MNKAIAGDLKEWEKEPKPSLALIILTDQFTRSIFKVIKASMREENDIRILYLLKCACLCFFFPQGTPKAFSGDAIARPLSRKVQCLCRTWYHSYYA